MTPIESLSADADVRALETLLARKRHASEIILKMDMYDHRGGLPADGPTRARLAAEEAQANVERSTSLKDLTALVERLRRERPEAIARWADAHDDLLAAFLAARPGAARGSLASTAASVANEERRAWAAVKRGEQAYVDENTYYVAVDRARYVALFGIDP